MRQTTENGKIIHIIEGVDYTGQQKLFGLPKSQIVAIRNRGSAIKLTQLVKIVDGGLVMAKCFFQGLNRPLCVEGDMDADRLKLVLSWKPHWDYWWNEKDRFDSAKIEFREAPVGRVFVVIASPNKDRGAYPTADFWIERWCWVRESNTLANAPISWEDRYDKKLKG